MTFDAADHAGKLVAAEALRLWNLDVYDPSKTDRSIEADRSRAIITDIISVNGWGFALPYRGNGPPQWCGMFAGKCWLAAGLNPSWLPTYWASTYRLHLWGTYQKFDQKRPNPKPVATTDLRVAIKLTGAAPLIDPLPGDVIVVGDGDPTVGDHITICIGYDADRKMFDTISGNGGGVGPKGNRREGISRRDYGLAGNGYIARWLYRPAFSDLLLEAPAP